jgi:small subunit ribosomal protein S16|tara:strand:- start:917 stop:1216 length:300 start_codon:yes stop_codon:yes gene_type:complete
MLESFVFHNIFKGLPMVVIRLARGGSKKRPFYSLVAADSRNRRDGRFIERIGFYNPLGGEGQENLRIALDRVEYWASNGAKLSPAVQRLVKTYSEQAAA